MKRFSVALPDRVLEALERVAQANHWSRERAARVLIREALIHRSEIDSKMPAQMIHGDRGAAIRAEVQLEIGGLG